MIDRSCLLTIHQYGVAFNKQISMDFGTVRNIFIAVFLNPRHFILINQKAAGTAMRNMFRGIRALIVLDAHHE